MTAPLVHESWSHGCTLTDDDRPNGDARDAYAVCPVCEPVHEEA